MDNRNDEHKMSPSNQRHTGEQLTPESSNSTNAPSLPVQYKVYRRRWAGLIILMAMNIVISWGWLTFAPVSKASVEFFGLANATPINWLSTVIFFAYAVASPAVIYIVNKHGIKRAIALSSLLSLVGFWLRYLGSALRGGNFAIVMTGQVLIGFAQPFVLNVPTYYSDKWFTSRGRVSATALVSLSNPFGAAIGQLVNPFLATHADDIPRMVLYIAIIATVPCLLATLIPASPPTPPCASSAEKKMVLREGLGEIWKEREFLLVFVMFSVYLGIFNAFSSLLNQILEPYGYTTDEAGFVGAVLIVVGLLGSAIISPIIDRTHAFLLAIKLAVPIIAACYIAFIFAPTSGLPRNLAGPMVVSGVLGATSFSLLPLALEYVVERTHPVSPEITSTVLWVGGQILGGVFLLTMDALRDEKANNSMKGALIFQASVAGAVALLVFGLSKGTGGANKRVQKDRQTSSSNLSA